MTTQDWVAERFEEHRAYLRAVAYRMLGSLSDADDALQEVWLRLSRADAGEVRQVRAWLTTIVGRVCLNMLRARDRRREEPLDIRVPDPIVSGQDGGNPEDELLLANSVGLALLVVLETLKPPERLAFVLHDVFAVPFDQIATVLGRSPTAARQLASRARRRIHGQAKIPDADIAAQHEVVAAFFAAARDGDFERLVALLDPDIVMRVDAGVDRSKVSRILRGATAVANASLAGALSGRTLRPALVNGAPGAVLFEADRPVSVMGFTVAQRRIVEINAILDPDRLHRLKLDEFGA